MINRIENQNVKFIERAFHEVSHVDVAELYMNLIHLNQSMFWIILDWKPLQRLFLN